ncbi:cyclic lactone autoinducer peptide [Clostridium felsineum]|uniref:cyclic lactone autoinducer peptide n=1 Tax=Clostridium felsineum TaxID=36839 RepID=UPI00098C7E0E|nr:cyclic lactone autoinducer peptide [Clostridium felsineum]MCR3758933.1 cyclic lactone autoinducer peptide [Clostridium felsineum]URZ14059.1 hypothetical protein CLFE_000340 [Clostridium felsineum DSM 794]
MNLKKQVNKIGEKFIEGIGKASMKIGEQASDTCVLITLYEPKMPEELLKENLNK